jgi:hypothetical protein
VPPSRDKSIDAPTPRFTTFAVLSLLAAAVLTVAGSVPADSFARTGPYELITGSDGNPWCGEDDDASVADDPADLRGAHFAFSLSCLFETPAIPRDLAVAAPELRHVPPAKDGVEFVIFQVAPHSDYPPEYATEPERLTSWIQVGGERIELSSAPNEWNYFVLSAPVGEPVVLWVDDADRAQGLDLRSGDQVDPVTSYYNDIGLWTQKTEGFEYEEVRFRNGRRTWKMTCTRSIAEITRAVWTEENGWAPEGSVWLTVRFNWCGDSFSDTIWTLDRERALLAMGGSEYLELVAWEEEPADGYGQIQTVVYAAPADTAEFKVFFCPAGEVTEKESGQTYRQLEMPSITTWAASY